MASGWMPLLRRAAALIVPAAAAPLLPFAVERRVGLDHPGLAYVAAVLAATALSTVGGVAAAIVSAVLFAFGGRGKDAGDATLLLLVAAAIPVLAGTLRREQARLRSSEHRFRVLVEQLPVGLYIDRPEASATNVYSNPQIERMLGYPAARWQESDFFPSLLHPDDREGVLARLDEAIAAGESFEDRYRLRAADGTYRWLVDKGALVDDVRGRALHVQGVLLDVTAAREAEERAEEIGRRYQSLIEELPLVTYVEDARELGRTLFISPQVVDFLGYPVEQWLADKDFFFTVLDPEFHHHVRDARAAGSTDTTHVYRLVAADGSYRWIDSRRSLVRDEHGRPLYVQGFWVDMTARRELEDQLRRQDRLDAVGQLAAGVAHNFNNMLLAIRGYAELAANRDSLQAVRGDLEIVHETVDRSAELVRHLLAFSRRQTLMPEPTDLHVVIGELLDLLSQLVGSHIAIDFVAPGHSVVATVDRSQIEQALVNLVVNARDAMADGGKLTITLGERRGGDGRTSVVLTVSDTGVGIADDVAARIFDPFFTTKEHGSGLGLATVHGTISQSGGDIRLLRTALGAGTTFEIELPATAEAQAAVA